VFSQKSKEIRQTAKMLRDMKRVSFEIVIAERQAQLPRTGAQAQMEGWKRSRSVGTKAAGARLGVSCSALFGHNRLLCIKKSAQASK